MPFPIPDRIRGFLFTPGESFRKVESEDLEETVIYFVIISLIYTILSTIIAGIAVSKHPAVVLFGLGFGSGNIVLSFAIILALTMAITLAYAVWLHLWIILICRRRGLSMTIRIVMYHLTPAMLIGWIPLIGAFTGSIWSLFVGLIGIQELHDVTFARALLALLASIITAGILATALFGPLFADVIASGPALIGPYHYRPLL